MLHYTCTKKNEKIRTKTLKPCLMEHIKYWGKKQGENKEYTQPQPQYT